VDSASTSSQISPADTKASGDSELDQFDEGSEFAACIARLEDRWPAQTMPVPAPILTSLGRYQIQRELGRGRFGVVFLATDPDISRNVALKIQQFDAAMDPDLRERFRGEALSAGQLQHPAIVHVHDVGQEAGVDFLTMEYIEGMTLAERLKLALFSPRDAASLVAQLADAIQHAHERDIIHRDIKPSNILIDKLDRPHITDFGLARRMSDSQMRATMTGQVLGTPTYMSPEQATARSDVGPLTDVYSLGVVLYEILTGRPPFQAASFVEAVECILNAEPIPPSKLNRKIPRELDAIVLKSLEKSPPQRYSSAAALAEDLQSFLDGRPIKARTLGPVQQVLRWCRRNPSLTALMVSAAMLIGLLLTTFSVYAQLRHSDELARKNQALAEQHELLSRKNQAIAQQQELLARNNEELAKSQEYFAELNDLRNIVSRQDQGWTFRGPKKIDTCVAIGSQSTNQRDLRDLAAECLNGLDLLHDGDLDPDMHIGRIAISPSGKWLAVGELKAGLYCRVALYDLATRQKVRTINIHLVMDNLSRVLTNPERWPDGVREFAFSGDERFLAVGMRHASILVYDLEDETKTPVELMDGSQQEAAKIQFSHDGKSVFLFNRIDSHFLRWQNWQTKPEIDVPLPGRVGSLVVAPQADRVFKQYWTGASLEMLNSKLIVRENFDPTGNFSRGTEFNLVTDAHGKLLAGESDIGIRVYETRGGTMVRHIQDDSVGNEGIAHELHMSADGRVLMALQNDGFVRLFDVANGVQVQRLNVGRHDFLDAALDPAGRWIVVATETQLAFWKLQHSPVRRVLNAVNELVEDMQFSPDGKTLATTAIGVGHHFHSILRTIDCNVGDSLAEYRTSMGPNHFVPAKSQVTWQSDQQLIWHTGIGTTCHQAADLRMVLDHPVLPLVGATLPVEFTVSKGAVSKATAKSANLQAAFRKDPHPQDDKRYISRVHPRGLPFQVSCTLPKTARPKDAAAFFLLTLKLDAPESFEPAFQVRVEVDETAVNHDVPTQLFESGRTSYLNLAVPVPEPAREMSKFQLIITPRSSVRTLAIEQINYLECATYDRPGGWPGLVDVSDPCFQVAENRLWANVNNHAKTWRWPHGEDVHDWVNPDPQNTRRANIRCVLPVTDGVLVGTRDGYVHRLNANTAEREDVWSIAGREVVAGVFCSSAQLAMAGGDSGKVTVLQLPSGNRLCDFQAHREAVVALAATPDGKQLITASADRELKFWRRNGDTFELYCNLPATEGLCRKLRLSPDGSRLAVLCWSTNNVELWNLNALRQNFAHLEIE
jgi:serine/threonine protein kinase/WD40 repeat protein